jgi:hypothetical protein
MLKFEQIQNYKRSKKYGEGGKISDVEVVQIIIQTRWA